MITNTVKTKNNAVNPKTINLVTEIQRLIVKINDLLQHKDEAEYLVDLLSNDVIDYYGRERAVEAARVVLKESVSQELSQKCTDLWNGFDKQYFTGWLLSGHRVQVRYHIDGGPIYGRDGCNNGVVNIPATSEPILVEQILEQMIQRSAGTGCWECYQNESNRVFLAGAPMKVEPNMRHLSAQEFIAAATREPMTAEEHNRMIFGDARKALPEVKN